MKNKLVLFVLFSNVALASGPSSSGGGMAVVCYTSGKVMSTQLLDYYEATKDSRKTVLRASGSVQEDYFKMVRNTYTLQGHPEAAKNLRFETLKNINTFLQRIVWVKNPNKLTFLNDQGKYTKIPTNCRLEQLAVFHDSTDKVYIQKEIWDNLDSANQAALVIHELFYKSERNKNESTSETARSYTKQIVSLRGNTPAVSGIEDASYGCISVPKNSKDQELSYFFVIPTADGTILQFTQISGRPLLVKTYVHLPYIEWKTERSRNPSQSRRQVAAGVGRTRDIYEIRSEHAKNWKLKVDYKQGSPITMYLINSSGHSSKIEVSHCSPR